VSAARLRVVTAYGGLAVTIGFSAAAVGLYFTTKSTPVTLDAPRPIEVAFAAVAIAFAAVGAVILLRRPQNPVGWLFVGLGTLIAFSAFAQQFAVYAVIGRSSPLTGGAAAAWLQSWSILSSLTSGVGMLLLLFPDGRLLSRRWRRVAVGVGAGFALFAVGYLVDPGNLRSPFSSVDNPFGIGDADAIASVLIPIGFLVSVLSILAAALSLVLRFRRAGGAEREQIKWLAFAGAALAVSIFVVIALDKSDTGRAIASTFLVLALVGIPAAAGMAILRYRLYEIDVVINRTLVYGSLTALLAASYLGFVLLLELALRPLTGGSGLAVALSTLAVAALFRPARNRIQAIVDRRFYRHKYDAERTLAAFASRLRDEVDLDALRAELTAVVAETMQPAHVWLWLRDGGGAVTPAVTVPRRLLSTKEVA
jgi:hypothetical protein